MFLFSWALASAAETYVCPMHSEVRAMTPGKCRKCGMALRSGAPAVAAADAGAPIRIPDVTVQDQNGRSLSFYTDLVKGKTVAINFIFTTCTTTCPLLAANFRKVQLELGERVGRDVHLISISVDPLTDIPERLQAFAAQHNAGPGWTFVTGAQPQIDQLLRGLGTSVADKNSHTPMILAGNEPAHHWHRVSGLAPAATIVKVINQAALESVPAVR